MFPVYTGFERIVEERIKEAQKKGEFKNLEGSGRPLPREDLSHIPEELRLAYRILKNADCLPPELELKKEIKRTEALLEETTDVRSKYKTMKKLNFLIMKLNMQRKGKVQFEVPQKYEGALLDRLASGRDREESA